MPFRELLQRFPGQLFDDFSQQNKSQVGIFHLRLGLVHQVATATELDSAVEKIATSIVANSPNAVRECKQLVIDLAGREIDAALMSDTAERIARIRSSDEGREGVRSFLEKSKPSWLA